MSYTINITSQGQLSLPVKIRRELGFSKTNKAILSVQSGKVVIEPVEDLLDLKGSIKTSRKSLLNQDIHDLFANSVVEEYKNNKR